MGSDAPQPVDRDLRADAVRIRRQLAAHPPGAGRSALGRGVVSVAAAALRRGDALVPLPQSPARRCRGRLAVRGRALPLCGALLVGLSAPARRRRRLPPLRHRAGNDDRRRGDPGGAAARANLGGPAARHRRARRPHSSPRPRPPPRGRGPAGPPPPRPRPVFPPPPPPPPTPPPPR